MRAAAAILAALLAACTGEPGGEPGLGSPPPAVPPASDPAADAEAMRGFIEVSRAVMPVAEAACDRLAAPGTVCAFHLDLTVWPRSSGEAYMATDRFGRPEVAVTLPIVTDAANRDEMAFMIAHEAAHHIAGHIGRTTRASRRERILAEAFVERAGAGPRERRWAARIGGLVGARRLSKLFELEADLLGAVIAAEAGFDPVRGVEFFARAADPGNMPFGTHPPNGLRIAMVRDLARRLPEAEGGGSPALTSP